MHRSPWWPAVLLAAVFCACGGSVFAQADSASTGSGQKFTSGWKLLHEGDAEGTMEQDAQHPLRLSPHLLHITVSKAADPEKGRAGATSGLPIDVRENHWYDVTFSAVTDHGSVGLVFSLETADGTVLARTTLPEIGRGENETPGAPEPTARPWRNYAVGLHSRGTSSSAHLVIVPIEPTSVWLDDLTLTPRTDTPSAAK